MPIHLRPSGLTDERRVELQKEISNYREENPVCYLLAGGTALIIVVFVVLLFFFCQIKFEYCF